MAKFACRPIAVLTTLLLLAAYSAQASSPSAERPPVLVTLKSGADVDAFLAEHAAAKPTRLSEGVVLLGAETAGRIARDARVASAERDGVVRAASATWDQAGWDTASWDASSWDGASWDGASWDGASWDGASWDGSDDMTSPYLPTWGQRAVRAQPTPGGAGALVCLIDSGIDASHEQLRSRLWRDARGNVGIDLVDDDTDPQDQAGHGTHLAGIVSATPEGPMFGVSDARLATAKIFGANGAGTTSDLIRALAWCSSIESDVILMALTEDAPTKALRSALREARDAGAVLVASAGNAGSCERCVSSPAIDENVLAVASIHPGFGRSSFSSSGPQVDLAMPGSMILSTYPDDAWRVGSGTSQAAAFAAGAIAALVGEGATPDEATGVLIAHALDLERRGRDHDTGHGLGRMPAREGDA